MAPLWPFLGVLGELGILISTIGAYEVKKRSNKEVHVENPKTKNGKYSEEPTSSNELRKRSVIQQ